MVPRNVEELAGLVDEIAWTRLPDSVAAATRRCVLHLAGTIFLGADRDIGKRVVSYAEACPAGPATAHRVGHGLSAPEAAFVNSALCHADFRDDAHPFSQSHPGVTVVPAALASAELMGEGLDPGAVGAGIVAGYQVIGRLGRMAAIASTERGFRASAIYTVFGAAAASAKVLGLSRRQTQDALALAAHTASGLNQPYLDGTDDWILLPGFAARNGVFAALLAREGIAGAPRVLDGEIGFFGAYAGLTSLPYDLEPPEWEIEVTRLKTVLTCNWNQAAAVALLTARVGADTVERIDVSLSPEAYDFPGVVNQGPFPTYTLAVLSLPYALGAVLATGHLDARSFRDVTDDAIGAAARRVFVRKDPDFTGLDVELDVTTTTGRHVVLRSPGSDPRGLRTEDDVIEALRAKFAQADLDPAVVDRLVPATRSTLSGEGPGPLMDLLRTGA